MMVSGLTAGAALLGVGIIVGAGLIFGTLSLTGSLGQKTVTETATTASPSTTTVTTTSTLILTFQVTVSSTPGSSAQVSAQATSCTKTAGIPPTTLVCTVTLTNTGKTNVIVDSCSINVSGTWQPATATKGGGVLIVPVGSVDPGVTCTTNGTFTEPAVGSQALGAFTLSGGVSIPFSGVWS